VLHDGTNSTDTFSTELLRTIANSIDPTYYLKALNGKASWNDPVFTQSIDILRKMQDDGIIGQDATSIKQYPESNNNFLSQKAAIVQMGTWYAQYAAKESMTELDEGRRGEQPQAVHHDAHGEPGLRRQGPRAAVRR
jgi:hypothetical protein